MSRTLRNSLIIAAAIAVIGLIIGIVAFAFGGLLGVSIGPDGVMLAKERRDIRSISETYTTINSLDVNVDLRDVIIKHGDQFKIESKGVGKNFNLENINNNIIISEKGSTGNIINLFNFTNERKTHEDLYITIPKSIPLVEIKVGVDSGKINISDVQADKIITDNDLGDVNISNVTANTVTATADSGSINLKNTNTSIFEFSGDLGDINAENITAREVKGNSSSGGVDISGTITGPIDISNDLGDIDLMLIGQEPSYSYEIETDLGDIEIDGKGYGSKVLKEYDNKPMIKLYADSGSVNIDFK